MHNFNQIRFLGLLFIGVLFPTGVFGQFTTQEDPIPETTIELSIRIEPEQPRPGEHARIIIQGDLHPGWHVFSLIPAKDEFAPPPTRITSELQSDSVTAIAPFYETNPVTEFVPALDNMELSYHEDKVLFFQNIKVKDRAQAAALMNQSVQIRYQTCSDKICLPPKTETLSASFTSGSGPARGEYSTPRYDIDLLAVIEPVDELNDALKDGLWGFIGLAIISGLLALLTPCVFPMIPVTIAFFTKQENASYGQIVRLSLIFGAGIIGTYTITGMGLSVLLGAAGAVQLATNGTINFAIGLLFTVFAFSLMGFFNLALPGGFSNRMDQMARRAGGPIGVLLMGFVFTLTAFTCTVQFVGTMLIAASQGHWLWPIIGMLVFSTVFAFPFFLLGLLPKLIGNMQSQSGMWLSHTKIILGLVELAAAFKFFSNADLVWQWGVIDREFVLMAWIVLSLMCALYLLGMITIHHLRVEKNGIPGFVMAFTFLLLSVHMIQGLGGAKINGLIDSYLPPELSPIITRGTSSKQPISAGYDVSQVHDLPWGTNLAEALDQAKSENKKVFVDFTGYTCVNCRWMEKNIFASPQVLDVFKKEFVLVQLYTDGGENYQENQALQVDRFHTVALPFYVVLDANNRMLSRHAGIVANLDKFLSFLQQPTSS